MPKLSTKQAVFTEAYIQETLARCQAIRTITPRSITLTLIDIKFSPSEPNAVAVSEGKNLTESDSSAIVGGKL